MRRILTYGDKQLRKRSIEVEYNEENLKLAKEMLEIMYDAPGIGLAAPQIGILKRIIVIDVNKEPIILFNPEIISFNEELTPLEEGCLSVPGINAEVYRPSKIKLRAINEKGVLFEKDYDDILAKVFQHEIDHLNGILFVDKVSDQKRILINSALNKLKKRTLKGK